MRKERRDTKIAGEKLSLRTPALTAGACGVLALCAVSCKKPFNVNVQAEEPIKLDVSMDVHVYQHGGSGAAVKTKTSSQSSSASAAAYKNVLESRRNRMAEIQTLKNNRLVGESHTGLLELRKIPDGDYGDYVKKTVREENSDRTYLIEYESTQKNKTLSEVKTEQWRHAQRKAHPGEWIEVASPESPGGYKWVEKKSPAGDANDPNTPIPPPSLPKEENKEKENED